MLIDSLFRRLNVVRRADASGAAAADAVPVGGPSSPARRAGARAASAAGAAVALWAIASGPAAAQTALTDPTIDTSVCVTGICDSDFVNLQITWTNSNTGASSRVVLVRVAPGASVPSAPPDPLTDPSVVSNGLRTSPHTFRGVEADMRYVVFVRAEQTGMTSSSWVRTPNAFLTRLPAVTGFQVVPTVRGFRASWNPPTALATSMSSDVSYRLDYRCPAGNWNVVNLGTATSRAVGGLVEGVPCEVQASAVRTARTGRPSSLTVVPLGPAPGRVLGVRVEPLDGALRVSWSAAAGPVSQYRVHAEDASGRFRRAYTDAGVTEAVVDGLVNGVEYTVTVTALALLGGPDGPSSESRTATPSVGAGDPGDGDDTDDTPVPALPLAGAGVLAGLLAAAGAYRRRRAARAPAA